MASQNSEEGETLYQAGVVPYRRTTGEVEFCLITSTEGRWIVLSASAEIVLP